jgi:hypothetical protein
MKWPSIILLGIILFLHPACLTREEFSPEELQALVDRELERKLEAYQRIRLERCREEMLAQADAIVDSLLFLENSLRSDSVGMPRTSRPMRPELRPVPDTRPVAPLFKDLADSLKNLDSLRKDLEIRR